MGELLPRQRAEARSKGWMAVGAWAGAALLGTQGWWFLGLAAAAVAVWLTRAWFSYRAQWGLRF